MVPPPWLAVTCRHCLCVDPHRLFIDYNACTRSNGRNYIAFALSPLSPYKLRATSDASFQNYYKFLPAPRGGEREGGRVCTARWEVRGGRRIVWDARPVLVNRADRYGKLSSRKLVRYTRSIGSLKRDISSFGPIDCFFLIDLFEFIIRAGFDYRGNFRRGAVDKRLTISGGMRFFLWNAFNSEADYFHCEDTLEKLDRNKKSPRFKKIAVRNKNHEKERWEIFY